MSSHLSDNGNSQHCKKGDSNSGELELLEKLTLFVNSYESIDSKVYGKGLVVYQSSTNFISSLYAKQRKGGISCPHTYYQRSSPLDKKRIWLTLYHLIYSDFQRDVLWTGAHGCGLSFAVTAMHMECLDLRKAGVFDELLLRIDGELFSIRLSDCAKVKASDSSASSASSSYSMPSPHQSGGAYEGISDPLLFTVSHVPLKSSSLDELSNHLDNEQYENKVVILILEFLPSELERQVFICFARTDVKVRILYVSSSREHYSKFRGLFVLNIPTFLVEPMSDHELMESAAAQLDLDRSDCHWADDGNGGQLDRAQALKQCRERQLVVGNIPRYVFAHQHVFETREYQLHNSRDFQLEEFGILRDLTFVPERSSAFIAPMFRFGVTIPMVSLLNEYAAPELFAAQCQEPLDQDITIHWHSGSITMIFVSETARKHVMKHVTTEKHIRILNDLGLLNPHEMQLVRTALLMRYPLPSFIVEQYRVSDWKFYQDPGPHTLLYCDTDSGCTSVRLPTVEMFNKIRCCIREEDFENDTLQGQGRSANTLQPGVLYRSNQFASSLTMTEYVYSDREGGIEPMATECHHHHHHVYYVQVSRNSPAEHRIRMRDIQVVFDSLKLGDVVNAAYKLVFVYVTDWCHADITGLAFECVVMNGEKRNFGLLEMQAMDSGTVFEGVRDPVGMANRMESIIVTACFHPNTWKGAIQSQQEGPVEYKHCLSYIQGLYLLIYSYMLFCSFITMPIIYRLTVGAEER